MRLYRFCSLLAALGMLSLSTAAVAQESRAVSRTSYGYVQADEAPYAAADVNPPLVYAGAEGGGDRGWGSESYCSNPWTLFPEDAPFVIGGWAQGGYHNKTTPLSTVRGDGLAFNDVPHRFNIHQLYLYAERVADGDRGLDWGFRLDAMYGTDARYGQSFGQTSGWDVDWDHGVYGWALPQAYVELASGPLSVKAGHFYTIIGYEAVPAISNFFYSHSYTMFNSEPFTHTGVLASLEVADGVTVYGGWTLGWDTGFEQFAGGSNFLGGISFEANDWLTLTYATTIGDFGMRGDDGYMHSIVATVQLTDSWQYVVQSDYLTVNGPGFNDSIGINQYLFYWFNDCLGWGNRLEWWKADGISRWEATTGFNVKAHANWVLRPEIRYDWHPGQNFDQWTFGVDSYVTW